VPERRVGAGERGPQATQVVIASVPVYSHVAPLLAIGGDLVGRGHKVTFLTGHRFREAVEATGASFAGLPKDADYDPARLNEDLPERAGLEGRARLEFDMRHNLTNPLPAQHAALQELLRRHARDRVVLLQENGFLGMWPALLGAPGIRPAGVIGLGIQPLTVSSVDTGPFGFGMPPDSSANGRARNRAAYRQMRDVFAGVQANLIEMLRSVGATAPPPFILDGNVALADRYLQLSVAGLEYPRSDLPPNVTFVGAVARREEASVVLPEWWHDVLEAERVIVVSQGTIANTDFSELTEPTLRALADLDVLVVATLGRGARLDRVPANARVATFVPFAELLPHTDVLVSNGGYGGVQLALAHGVPMVLAGQTEDKSEVTARAAWTGAGVNLATQRPTPQQIRTAVEEVLRDPTYRRRAFELRREYAAHDPYAAIAAAVASLAADG
jgi:UDP:flavonoid glycosyltransferase YjiC (YdhE family)